VDPPVLKSGPPSRTTTSRQPIRVKCSATPQPTMLAPMITMPVLSSIAKPPSVSEAMARHPSTWDEVGGSVPARRQCPLLLEGRRPAFALVPYNGPLPYIGTLNTGLLLGQGGAVGWRPSGIHSMISGILYARKPFINPRGRAPISMPVTSDAPLRTPLCCANVNVMPLWQQTLGPRDSRSCGPMREKHRGSFRRRGIA
jgi:hypothetical protein